MRRRLVRARRLGGLLDDGLARAEEPPLEPADDVALPRRAREPLAEPAGYFLLLLSSWRCGAIARRRRVRRVVVLVVGLSRRCARRRRPLRRRPDDDKGLGEIECVDEAVVRLAVDAVVILNLAEALKVQRAIERDRARVVRDDVQIHGTAARLGVRAAHAGLHQGPREAAPPEARVGAEGEHVHDAARVLGSKARSGLKERRLVAAPAHVRQLRRDEAYDALLPPPRVQPPASGDVAASSLVALL
mmetsp:Transcript_26770/g.107224  ORF Transcript_26770/g.107224 Transcript_26770/m.107224 type:complete len:246 (-) Transcript_26770:1086-1823(-)